MYSSHAVQNMSSPLLLCAVPCCSVLRSVNRFFSLFQCCSVLIQSTSSVSFLFCSVLFCLMLFILETAYIAYLFFFLCSVLPHCCSGVRWSASSFCLFRSASLLFTYDGQPVLSSVLATLSSQVFERLSKTHNGRHPFNH